MKLKNVLSINADSKTIKGLKKGFVTGILYLAPYKLSGFNVCPNAVNCIKSCLFNAGRGKFSNVIQARINKTLLFIHHKKYFLECIIYSVKALIRKAQRENLIPCIRLNGTSDINFYKFGLMNMFKNVQFYDYTKNRLTDKQLNKLPKNYHLTFSFDNTPDNIEYCKKSPLNFSVVFNTKNPNEFPKSFLGYKVINGDKSDLRFLDENKVCVGLTAKGSKGEINQGIKDNFIINPDLNNLMEVK
tara:strand:+ start:163 stop:894 length:732 start_codon:yes stop_codon:yes gene_type:complete